MITLPNFRIFIQTLRQTVETYTFNPLTIPDDPTLDDVREVLRQSALGEDSRDIFFPSWTKTIHVIHLDSKMLDGVPTFEEINMRRILVENEAHLKEIFNKAGKEPGTVSIILQECRSKRYTRKNLASNTNILKMPVPPGKAPPSVSLPRQDVPKYFKPQAHVYPTTMYAQDGSYGMYFDPMQQGYGLMPQAMFPQPYFVHYGCLPYGYVAPGFFQPVMPPPGYHFGF